MIPCLVSCFIPVRWLALAGLGVLLLWLSASVSCAARQPKPAEPPSSSSAFALTSTAFADGQPIPAGPVLLVDDMVDSRWTLTVSAWQLRKNGSGAVWPMALSQTGHDE